MDKFIECGSLKMPLIGLGTFQAKDERMERALDLALNLGYRHIDTAHFYENEAAIGRVLHRWLSSGRINRADLFITTKLPFYANKPELVEATIKQSLANLQLDFVDLYLVHFPLFLEFNPVEMKLEIKEHTDIVAVWKQMEEQVKAGRATTIGVSNYNIQQIQEILDNATIKPACHQFEIHLSLQQPKLIEFCKSKNIAIVSYSTLGCPNSEYAKEAIAKGSALKMPHNLENAVVRKLSAKYEKSPAQILLRHMIQQGIAIIPKSTNESRLKQNLDLFGFNLTEEDMAELKTQDIQGAERVFPDTSIIGLPDHPQNPFK